MLETMLAALSSVLDRAPALALAGALAWGVASVVLSPCHLAGIPLVVGFVAGQGAVRPRRMLALSVLFALGMLGGIAAVGGATAIAGRIVGDLGAAGDYLLAALFVAVGLNLLDVFQMPWSTPAAPSGRGPVAALGLGLLFGVALGPCTFAFAAPVLGLVLRIGGERPGFATALLGLFALGHCGVVAAAGPSTRVVQRVLEWSSGARAARWLRRGCGGILVLAGLYFLYSAR